MGDLNNLYINYYLFTNKNKKLSKSENLSKNILTEAKKEQLLISKLVQNENK